MYKIKIFVHGWCVRHNHWGELVHRSPLRVDELYSTLLLSLTRHRLYRFSLCEEYRHHNVPLAWSWWSEII